MGKISIGKMVFMLSLTATLLAVGVVVLVSGHVRERSIHDLARDEARQTSALVFEALYSAMRKGWSKDEIGEVVGRLQKALPELTVKVVRGAPVIAQFGEYDNDVAMAAADPILAKALVSTEEQFITQETSIRYLYPLVVREECLVCHTQAKLGEINGVIDIVYPIHALKVSLDYVLNTVLGYFFVILVLLSVALWIKLKLFVARPIAAMVTLMQDIILRTDLRRRVESKGFIREVNDLTDYFNKLLRTVEDYQVKLEDLSMRDPLTRAYNRKKFVEFLAHEVDRATRHHHQFCVIQIDLDDFKTVNDAFGHPVGDLLLKELANLLDRETRRTDVVARLGADEFMILLPETSLAEGLPVAEKLRNAIAENLLDLPMGAVRITASLGFVAYPGNGTDVSKLTIAADVAVYKAKRNGKNQVAVLDGSEDSTLVTFNKGEMVRSALAEGRLVPFFQPIMDTMTGMPAAYEVLARVMDNGRAISAGDFIESAEELGLAGEVDKAMFDQALEIMATGAMGNAKLFLNLSARTLCDTERMMSIPARLARAGIAPEQIVLELTEREALPHFGEIVRLVNDLRAQGLAFALDDFGSGFSSFLYLKYIQVDYVKIEGSFVRHMVTDERDRIMVEHIHSMARRFGLMTVAEFVEDEDTMDMLRAMGIDRAQGFHLGMPEDLRPEAARLRELAEA